MDREACLATYTEVQRVRRDWAAECTHIDLLRLFTADLGKYFLHNWTQYPVCCFWTDCSKPVSQVNFIDSIIQVFYILPDFILLKLPVIEWRLLKSLTLIMELLCSPCSLSTFLSHFLKISYEMHKHLGLLCLLDKLTL